MQETLSKHSTIDKLRILSAELDLLDAEDSDKKEREVFLLLNAVTDMVVVTDVNGVIKYANPSSYRTIGYDPDALIGNDVSKFFDVHDIATLVNKSTDTYANTKDGCSIPVHMYVGELRDGTVHLFIAIIRKVS